MGTTCKNCHHSVLAFDDDTITEDQKKLSVDREHERQNLQQQSELDALTVVARGPSKGIFTCDGCTRYVEVFRIATKDDHMRALRGACYISYCYIEHYEGLLTLEELSQSAYRYDNEL